MRDLTVFYPKPGKDFVVTHQIKDITNRAISYIQAGYPVNFSGPTGVGKTTLALHLASQFDQGTILIHGDEELSTSGLVGEKSGYRRRYVRDNFIGSVLKIEENASKRWSDQRLTHACKNGFILVYDEFSRSRPEANNVLLSVLEEGVLELPGGREDAIKVHPNFKAIFTSNPAEYAGVHTAQDALLDRMITIHLEGYNKKTECAITEAKSGLPFHLAQKLVKLVHSLQNGGLSDGHSTLRSAIKIGKAIKVRGGRLEPDDPIFAQICIDVLNSMNNKDNQKEQIREAIQALKEE